MTSKGIKKPISGIVNRHWLRLDRDLSAHIDWESFPHSCFVEGWGSCSRSPKPRRHPAKTQGFVESSIVQHLQKRKIEAIRTRSASVWRTERMSCTSRRRASTFSGSSRDILCGLHDQTPNGYSSKAPILTNVQARVERWLLRTHTQD